MAAPSLNLPRVAEDWREPPDAARLADHVDELARQLEEQSTRLVPPPPDLSHVDATELGGIPAEGLVARAASIFSQTFEDEIEEYWLRPHGEDVEVSYPSNGIVGGKTLRVAAQASFEFPRNIPFDPTRIYRVRVRLKAGASSAHKIIIGWSCYAADGETRVDREGGADVGKPHVVCLERAASDSTGNLTEYKGYVWGHAAAGANGLSSPLTGPLVRDDRVGGRLHASVRYFRPFIWVNAGGGDTEWEVDYLSVDDVTVSNEIVTSDTVGGGSEGGVVRDGDVVTFARPYLAVPVIVLQPRQVLGSPANRNNSRLTFFPDNVSISGFTCRARWRGISAAARRVGGSGVNYQVLPDDRGFDFGDDDFVTQPLSFLSSEISGLFTVSSRIRVYTTAVVSVTLSGLIVTRVEGGQWIQRATLSPERVTVWRSATPFNMMPWPTISGTFSLPTEDVDDVRAIIRYGNPSVEIPRQTNGQQGLDVDHVGITFEQQASDDESATPHSTDAILWAATVAAR